MAKIYATNRKDFFGELKRRNVYKVAVAYAVVGWLMVQVATQVFPFFEIPPWTVRLVVLLIAIGFPIALIIAWAFELTPEGIKRTIDVDRRLGHTSEDLIWLYVAVIGAALSITLFFIGRYTASRAGSTESGQPVVPAVSLPAKSIAILPFENLSEEKANAYFAEGIQDEILTKLAAVRDLKVISRTSTAKYQSKPDNLKAVANELGVATVLEGAVQKSGDKVRVNVQLIDARADSHLWAKTYDRDLKDLFAVESEIAQEVADSLQARLSPTEANSLTRPPTQDPGAYDLFLKGEYEFRLATSNLRPESFDQALAWYQQAIARDPNFALAIAKLVECRMQRHWSVEYLSEADLADVRKMADRALSIAPNLAEGHLALGTFYYFGYRNYDQALAEYQRAVELQPNNSQALQFAGYVHRRQGKWQESFAELNKALEQDPRDASLTGNIASSYLHLRMWKDAERMGRRAITLDPYEVVGMRALLLSIENGSGAIDEVQRLLATFPPESRLTPNSTFGSVPSITGERAYAFVIVRKFDEALKVWEAPGTTAVDERRRISARVAIRVLAGDVAGAQTDAHKAVKILEDRLQKRPNEILAMTQLSWTYLSLNRNADAVKVARHGADLMPPEKDAMIGDYNLTGLAEIYARTGYAAEAIAILRRLLAIPAGDSVSIARLKIDPVWDPIRNDPGFQRLLTGTEHVGP